MKTTIPFFILLIAFILMAIADRGNRKTIDQLRSDLNECLVEQRRAYQDYTIALTELTLYTTTLENMMDEEYKKHNRYYVQTKKYAVGSPMWCEYADSVNMAAYCFRMFIKQKQLINKDR